MRPPVQYRVFEEDDLHRVLELANETLDEDYDGGLFLHFARMYPRGFLVAEAGGQIVGFVLGTVQRAYHARILALAVDPDWRRHGIGTRLARQFVENFRDFGVDRITLEVRVSNEPAIELYRSLGFEVEDAIGDYYGDDEDAYVMARKL